MSDLADDQRWEKRRLWKPQLWLIALLLGVIPVIEVQRTWAQAEAQRQPTELSITIAELNRTVDWLLLTQRPAAMELKLRPAPASSVKTGKRGWVSARLNRGAGRLPLTSEGQGQRGL